MTLFVLAIVLVGTVWLSTTLMRLAFQANRTDVTRNTQRLIELGPPTRRR